MSFSSPTGSKIKQVPKFSPQQMQLFQQLLGGASGGVGGGLDFLSKLASGDESAYEGLEAPAQRNFQSALGQIGSRYAGAGALGSSSFQNATAGAAQSFAENLQKERLGIRQNSISELLGLSQNLLGQQPYDTFLQKERSGWDTAGDISSIISKFLPLFF